MAAVAGVDSTIVWDDGSATDTAELLLTMHDCGLSVVSTLGDGSLVPIATGTLHLLQTAPSSLIDSDDRGAASGNGSGGGNGSSGSGSGDGGNDDGGGGDGKEGRAGDGDGEDSTPWLALLHVGGLVVPLPAIAPVARLDDAITPPASPVPCAGAEATGDTLGEPRLYMLALPYVSFVVHVPATTPVELAAEWEAALAQYAYADRLPPGGLPKEGGTRGVAGDRGVTASTPCDVGDNDTAGDAAASTGAAGMRPTPSSATATALFRAGDALMSVSARIEAAVREHGGRADAYWAARLGDLAARSSPRRPDDPWTMSDRQRKVLHRTRRVTGVGVRLTGGVANRLVNLLASSAKSRGGRAAARIVGGADGGHRDALRGLIEAGVVSYGSVYTALDETGRALLATTVESGSEVVAARHGDDAAEATRAVGGITRDAVLMARVVNKAGIKGMTRLVAKRQGKHVLHRVSVGMVGKER
ncbi:hypothetical protein MMPV_004263 [Pyropia vietnamensis]